MKHADQVIIKRYYEWSPAIVKAMAKDEEFKEWVKETLNLVLPGVKAAVQ